MTEYSQEHVQVAEQFGHTPEEVYPQPAKKDETVAKKPQGFQEEVATVEELLGGIAPEGEAPPMEIPELEAPMEEEEASSDVDSLITRLQETVDGGELSEEDKSSAEEMVSRLEELKAATANAEEFLAANEAPAGEPEVPEAGGEELIGEADLLEEAAV